MVDKKKIWRREFNFWNWKREIYIVFLLNIKQTSKGLKKKVNLIMYEDFMRAYANGYLILQMNRLQSMRALMFSEHVVAVFVL